MREKDQLLNYVAQYVDDTGLELIKRAADFAEKSHKGFQRLDGEFYIFHPIAVAKILSEWQAPPEIIAAGLLHDTLNPNCSNLRSLDAIEEHFSASVVTLVKGVAELGRFGPGLIKGLPKAAVSESKADQTSNKRLSWTIAMLQRSPLAVVIKIADKLHNIEGVNLLSLEEQARFAAGAFNIFAPLAHRLGMRLAERKLQDVYFCISEPDSYVRIDTIYQTFQSDLRIKNLVDEFQQVLDASNVPAQVQASFIHRYGIYRQQSEHLQQQLDLNDVLTLNVVTKSALDCYSALGVIHSQWRPSGDVQDYIANPRPNGYRALQTILSNPFTGALQVTFCSEEMYLVAEHGVIAKWYNVSNQLLPTIDPLPECPPNSIMVLTPKGEIKYLPWGAIPIDFAYAIHEEVGHRCMHAWVNGKKVELETTLQDGDIIEIIVNRGNTGPNPDWERYVVTETAKQYIKKWTRQNKSIEFIIETWDRVGLVEDISATISQKGFNIAYFHADALQDGKALIRIGLDYIDLTKIEQLESAIKKVAHVIRIQIVDLKERSQVHQSGALSQFGAGNPYTIGKPAFGRNFKGRKQEIDNVINRLRGHSHNNAILIWGQKRIGKTSLLTHLERYVLATSKECLPIYITMHDIPNQPIGFFLHRIAYAIEQKMQHESLKAPHPGKMRSNPIYYFRRFMDYIERAMQPQSLLIIVDEFQGIGQLIEEGATREDVFVCFRSLAQQWTNVSFLFSGGGLREHLLRQSGIDSLLSVVDYVKIDCLEISDARALITDLDQSVTYTDQAVNRLLEVTRAHPCYIQYLCRELYANMNAQRVIELSNVEGIIRQTLEEREKLEGLVEHFWNMDISEKDRHITYRSRLILSAIAENANLLEGIVFEKIAQKVYPRITERELAGLLNYLIAYGSVELVELTYRIRIPLFEMWLRESYPFNRLFMTMEE